MVNKIYSGGVKTQTLGFVVDDDLRATSARPSLHTNLLCLSPGAVAWSGIAIRYALQGVGQDQRQLANGRQTTLLSNCYQCYSMGGKSQLVRY